MRSLHYALVALDARIRSSVISIVRAEFGAELQGMELARSPMRGGLESHAVERLRVRGRDPRGNTRSLRLVAKQLRGVHVREAGVYRDLLAQSKVAIAPAVFAIEHGAEMSTVLLLEDVRQISRWPWRELSTAAAVLRQLARFHQASKGAIAQVPSWDYESVLQESAVATLERLRQMRSDTEFAWLRRSLRAVSRLVNALPTRRSELLNLEPYGRGPIHGDVHPGNAIVRKRGLEREVVLVDWARARVGSPLEDVSSWLQTLSYWEPEARRRHDTLLASYLVASGHDGRLSSELREAYWMAGASNALAGALRYYCWKAEVARSTAQRARAVHAARHWLRIVERAHAWSS